MLAFIKANYHTGDSIEITCSEGTFEGQIEYVNNKYIVLRLPNGKIYGIAATDIRTFTAACPVPVHPECTPACQEPADETTEDGESEDTADAPAGSREDEDAGDTLRLEVPKVDSPVVVGQIDLSKIDPKLARRKYFRSNEENDGSEGGYDAERRAAGEQPYNSYNKVYSQDREPDYVPAKGRITYYNYDKRYGFIHDFAADIDLYFYIQQVSDRNLYEHLRKGTKVVYSIDRNMQGAIARCIHLPYRINELLSMAEDHIDAGRYYVAQGMCNHILEVSPEHAEAKEMLEQIAEMQPSRQAHAEVPGGNAYNLYTTYTAAKKAYLAKDYALAEELYRKALDADEKPDSCVKDLITLYVSRYKQAESEEEKKTTYDTAATFFEQYKDLLPDNLTTRQFLALNYYLPVQDYDKFLTIVDDILTDPAVNKVLSRKIFYLWQKGIVLNKTGHAEEALALTEEGLALAPRSRQLLNLREYILHPEYHQNRDSQEADAASADGMNAADEAAGTPAESTDDATAEAAEPADDTTGKPESDEWWDELKKPAAF